MTVLSSPDRVGDAHQGAPDPRPSALRRLLAHPAWLGDRHVYVLSLFFGFIALGLALAALFLFHKLGSDGNATRFDFAAFWATAVMTLEGTPALAYDWELHKQVQQRGFENEIPGFMPWHYPPHFQVVVIPLGFMSVEVAQWAFTLVTFALYLTVVWAILPKRASLLMAAVPVPAFMLLIGGQTGFLTAAITGFALLQWHRRPIVSAMAFGIMSFKPQLVVAVPVAVVAAQRWAMLATGLVTVAACIALSWIVLGGETWQAFIDSVSKTGEVFVKRVEIFHLYTTVYGFLRDWGIGLWPAVAAQAVMSLAVGWAVVRAFRPSTALAPDAQMALLAFACMAISPRVFDYDSLTTYVGALFLLRHARAVGFFPGEKLILLFALVLTLVDFRTDFEANVMIAPMLIAAMLWGEGRRDPSTAAVEKTEEPPEPQAVGAI